MLMLTPQCLTTASQSCSHDCRLFLFLPWMESIRCVNKFQKHNELLGCGSILLKMVDWRGCQALPEKTKSKKKALSTVKFDFYLMFVQKTACLFFSSKANNSFNQPFCSLVNNSRYRPPTHPKHQNRSVVMHVQLFIGKILKQRQTYKQKYKKKAFVCFWVTGVWPHWTLVFTCREKVSCRSVSVSPAEDSRISLERRIRLEPWGGDRRRRDGEKKTKGRMSWQQGPKAWGKDGKIAISTPQPTPAESKQWTLINRMLQEKRGSKGGRGKREVKGRKLTDRREQRRKIEVALAATWKKN